MRFTIDTGLPDIEVLEGELDEYRDILLGRVPPPADNGILTLMEVADALYCRAKEIEALIHRAERNGDILKGSPLYKFRTGELRSFIDMAHSRVELGSRRVTEAKIQHDAMPGSTL